MKETHDILEEITTTFGNDGDNAVNQVRLCLTRKYSLTPPGGNRE